MARNVPLPARCFNTAPLAAAGIKAVNVDLRRSLRQVLHDCGTDQPGGDHRWFRHNAFLVLRSGSTQFGGLVTTNDSGA